MNTTGKLGTVKRAATNTALKDTYGVRALDPALKGEVCRALINLDEDSLLCQLVDGGSIPVPYFNTMNSKLAYIMAMGKESKLADIRHFFPDGISEKR